MVLVLVAGAAALHVHAAVPGRPSDVAEDSWRPIAKDLGLALTVDAGGRVRGTVMAFVDGAWRPVFVQNPSMPLPVTHR
jgi:hypothetical protein